MAERDRAKGGNGAAPVPTVRQAAKDSGSGSSGFRIAAKIVLFILFFFSIYATLVSPQFFGKVSLEHDDIAGHTIKSPVNTEYIDTEETRLLRVRRVADKAESIFNVGEAVLTDFNREIEVLYGLTVEAGPDDLARAEQQARSRGYSSDVIEHVRKMSLEELDQRIRYPGLDYVRELQESELRFPTAMGRDEALEAAIRDRVDIEGLIGPPRLVFIDVVRRVLNQNMIRDEDKEAQLRLRIENETPPVRGDLRKGEIIVQEGEKVTPLILDKLGAAGFLGRTDTMLYSLAGFFLMLSAFIGFAFFYLRRFHREMLKDDIKSGIFGFIVLFVTLLTWLLSRINSDPTLYLISFPVITGAFLVWIVVENNLSMKMAGALLLFMGVGYSLPAEPLFAGFAACLVGFAALPEDWGRMDLLKAGLFASLANMTLAGIFGFHGGESLRQTLWMVAYASLAGISAAAVSLGLFIPFFESLFRITTSSKLLELSGTDAPLLRRLMVEAPGTYQHSLMVGNLAQAAAEELGADALLARVGSYYHDIGKLRRPNFFNENQVSGVNPHDELSPSLSALIITSHIKDGIEAARHHRLPEEIIDIIAQHHGVTCIAAICQKARSQAEDESKVLIDDFRYNAPARKPQSLEAAIVLLADCIESAVRAMDKPTPVKMAQVIDGIVQSRLADGQFDDCHLTLKEIERIKNSFLRTLESIYHSRIEYPGAAEQGRKKK